MKKYLAVAMAALLLVCSLASCASGSDGSIGEYAPEVDYLVQKDEDGNVLGTFYFDEGEGETAILRQYVGKKIANDHVKVPAMFGDRVVTAIGKQAFYNLAAVVSVELPEGLLEIDEYAFAGCTELTEITLPATTVAVKEGAFLGCTALTKVTVSSSLETIGNRAFYGCSSMGNVNLPAGLISIGYGAFAFCESMTELIVPASVNTIGELAFTDCTGLEKITFISDATVIEAHAFEHSDGTNLKGQFVLTGLGADSKVMTYINALPDAESEETTAGEAETEAVTDPAA